MDKLLEPIKYYKDQNRNFRILFGIIGVLTIVNLGANLFNSYLAFNVKADQQELRQAQNRLIATNEQKIGELEMRQGMTQTRATHQSIIIKSIWHLIPQKDKDFILVNWENAEYGKAGMTPPQ